MGNNRKATRDPKQSKRVEFINTAHGAPSAWSNGSDGLEPSRQDIATLAYSYWEKRGCQDGSPEQDWLQAEQELRERLLENKA